MTATQRESKPDPRESAWQPFIEMCHRLSGDPVLIPAQGAGNRNNLAKLSAWEDIAEADIPRLAILTDSFSRFLGEGDDVSILTVWHGGTPTVMQIDGRPCEAALDAVTDVICGNMEQLSEIARNDAPIAANDNLTEEQRLRKAFDGGAYRFDADTRRHYLADCSYNGLLGAGFLDDEGVPQFAPHKNQPPPPIHATPFMLRDPASLPEREWLWGKHYIRRYLTSTVGAGGGGKSAHAVSEVLAMVTGQPLLEPDGPLTIPLRVWYVNAEDPQDEIDRRFHAGAKHFNVTAEQLGDRLFTDSGRDQEFVIMRQEGREIKVCQPLIDEMVTEIRRREIDVVIVDPFVSTHEVSENDNTAMQRVAKAWTEVADKANCCVEVIHHVVKNGSEVTADSARGGGALKDKTRSMRVLNPMTKDEAEKVGLEKPAGYFRVDFGKFNMVASGRSQWRRFASVPLGNGGTFSLGDEIGVVESWRWPSKDVMEARAAEAKRAVIADVPEDLLAGLKVRLEHGNYKAHPQGKPWAGDVVMELTGESDKAKAKARLEAWIDAGELEVVDILDIYRKPKPHIKPAAAP